MSSESSAQPSEPGAREKGAESVLSPSSAAATADAPTTTAGGTKKKKITKRITMVSEPPPPPPLAPVAPQIPKSLTLPTFTSVPPRDDLVWRALVALEPKSVGVLYRYVQRIFTSNCAPQIKSGRPDGRVWAMMMTPTRSCNALVAEDRPAVDPSSKLPFVDYGKHEDLWNAEKSLRIQLITAVTGLALRSDLAAACAMYFKADFESMRAFHVVVNELVRAWLFGRRCLDSTYKQAAPEDDRQLPVAIPLELLMWSGKYGRMPVFAVDFAFKPKPFERPHPPPPTPLKSKPKLKPKPLGNGTGGDGSSSSSDKVEST